MHEPQTGKHSSWTQNASTSLAPPWQTSAHARWIFGGIFDYDAKAERLKTVPQLRQALIRDAGHMLHHDQPVQLARLLEEFLD